MTGTLDVLEKILKDKFQFKADVLKSVKKIEIGNDRSVHITNNVLVLDPRALGKNNTGFSELVQASLNPEKKRCFLSSR